MAKDRRKVFTVKINAPNDTSGNPRRGWAVYLRTGEYLGFVDRGYTGRRALSKRFPNYVELCAIPVAAGVYNDYYKDRLN